MQPIGLRRRTIFTLCFSISASLLLNSVQAQMYINEVFFNAPGSPDPFQEYVELRGLSGASLADHYLIVLENEISGTANPGSIEAVFDLGSLSNPVLGSNGYLTIRAAGNPYTGLNPNSNNFVNTLAGATFGSGPASSSVGFTDEDDEGELEGSGGTYMLIKNNGGTATAPKVVQGALIDLDTDNNAELDASSIFSSWTVFDSIGINGETTENNAITYAPINFSTSAPTVATPTMPPGAQKVVLGYELEYFARWGDSTGSTADDWHVSNLTDNPASRRDNDGDLRQSGEPHGFNRPNQVVETSQGVPYGTRIQSTMGGPNLFIEDGDFNPVDNGEEYVFDGKVNGRDFLIWQRRFGFGLDSNNNPKYATRQHGDANHDRVVDGGDLALWQANYGAGTGSLLANATAVPEPSSVVMAMLGITLLAARRR
jgi:hypothetical protein